MTAEPRILIIGGGPTGLGAAWRCVELGHENWSLLEAGTGLGGLAASVVDDNGFTWDLGGHVLFSHYQYFDDLMDGLLADAWNHHIREAWVWMRDRFIPYPFQNNIWRLPEDERIACIDGLVELRSDRDDRSPANFEEWILGSFGRGIADVFMLPYNFKVWAHPPASMNTAWMGDRVATVDLARVIRNVVERQDDVAWGPNSTFRFPLRGGTGSIWTALADRLPADRVHRNQRVKRVDAQRQVVETETGDEFGYDILISTMPLDELLDCLEPVDGLGSYRRRFRWSSSHIIGIGLEGTTPDHLETKCWVYFPEESLPFYRATVFSNYSQYNVPQPGRQWSLMCEVSESPHRPVDVDRVVGETVAGLEVAGFIESPDQVVDRWHRRLPKAYPTPFLDRDQVLAVVEPALRDRSIYTRGRFGGWKYEVSNQDHSLMQGVECVNHLLDGGDELTFFHPDVVNKR